MKGKEGSLLKEVCLIDFKDKKYQNTWVIGTPPIIQPDSSKYSENIQISFSKIPPNPGRIEDFHSHSQSEEYYLVLEGFIKILVNKKVYKVIPMSLLSIPKNIPHKIIEFNTPLQYFTVRAPSALVEDKRIHKF